MSITSVNRKPGGGRMAGFQPVTYLRTHPLTGYFVLTFAITWLLALPLVASTQGWIKPPLPLWLHYLTVYGPLSAAFIMTAICGGRPAIHELWGRMVKWRVGVGWLLFSAFSLIALFVIAATILRILGQPWPNLRELGEISYLPNLGALGAWLLWILTSGFGEETGWRGFALPRLQKKHNALVATLILALFWALWHLPFFFYLESYLTLGLAFFPIFALGLLCGAIILTWLYNSTEGSILMVALWHGALNFITASKAGEGSVAAIMTTVIMVWAVLVVVIYKAQNLARKPRQML